MIFCATGIISAGRFHLYLVFLFRRDYFDRPVSSLSCFSAPQGLFRPVRFIPAWLFCSAGIIFSQPDASLSSSFVPQGLFPPVRCIPAFLFFTTGINSTGQMHLYLVLLLRKDYFDRPDASLSSSFAPQGLFLADRMHLYLPLFHHKDYFTRPDASLPSSFSPQGLFPPARCIPIFLFCSIGIISPQSDTSPIAESISAKPFRQLPILLSDQLYDKLDVICLQVTKRILIFAFFVIN